MAEILRKGQRGTLTCCCRATCSRNFEATTAADRARAGASAADGLGPGAAEGGGGRWRGRPVAWAAGAAGGGRLQREARATAG